MTNCSISLFQLHTDCPACSIVVQAVSLHSYKIDFFQEIHKASTPAFLDGFSEGIFAFIDEIRLAKKETFNLPLNCYFWFVVEGIFVSILSLT